MTYYRIFILGLFFFMTSFTFGQTHRNINGIVEDYQNFSLIWTSILAVDCANEAVANVKGKFTLENPYYDKKLKYHMLDLNTRR